jgi:hypothetical protein
MTHGRKLKVLISALMVGLAAPPQVLLACSACYGQSDSPLAKGMNWGIFSLLGVVVVVLASVATFFIFLAKKSAALSVATAPSMGGYRPPSENPSIN